MTFGGLVPNTTYTAAVVAYCDDVCMSATGLQGGQHIAYTPFVVQGYAPFSPTPAPGPNGGGGNGAAASSNAGAIAGGVIGGLLGVALLAGLGYLAYRNWETLKGYVPALPSVGGSGGSKGGADAYYATTKVGDGDAASSFLAYEPPSSAADAGAAYAAM